MSKYWPNTFVFFKTLHNVWKQQQALHIHFSFNISRIPSNRRLFHRPKWERSGTLKYDIYRRFHYNNPNIETNCQPLVKIREDRPCFFGCIQRVGIKIISSQVFFYILIAASPDCGRCCKKQSISSVQDTNIGEVIQRENTTERKSTFTYIKMSANHKD